jgi:DNA-damage-inducible protein J
MIAMKELIKMKTANYNIRLNPVIKSKAEETFAEFGLNLSEAINVFLHMSIKQCGFPFEIREPKFNTEIVKAIFETEQIIKDYDNGSRLPKAISNAYELFLAMDMEDEAEGDND